jgi:hypothetical protein
VVIITIFCYALRTVLQLTCRHWLVDIRRPRGAMAQEQMSTSTGLGELLSPL